MGKIIAPFILSLEIVDLKGNYIFFFKYKHNNNKKATKTKWKRHTERIFKISNCKRDKQTNRHTDRQTESISQKK